MFKVLISFALFLIHLILYSSYVKLIPLTVHSLLQISKKQNASLGYSYGCFLQLDV